MWVAHLHLVLPFSSIIQMPGCLKLLLQLGLRLHGFIGLCTQLLASGVEVFLLQRHPDE